MVCIVKNHLPGRHDQKRHGRRSTDYLLDAFEEDEDKKRLKHGKPTTFKEWSDDAESGYLEADKIEHLGYKDIRKRLKEHPIDLDAMKEETIKLVGWHDKDKSETKDHIERMIADAHSQSPRTRKDIVVASILLETLQEHFSGPMYHHFKGEEHVGPRSVLSPEDKKEVHEQLATFWNRFKTFGYKRVANSCPIANHTPGGIDHDQKKHGKKGTGTVTDDGSSQDQEGRIAETKKFLTEDFPELLRQSSMTPEEKRIFAAKAKDMHNNMNHDPDDETINEWLSEYDRSSNEVLKDKLHEAISKKIDSSELSPETKKKYTESMDTALSKLTGPQLSIIAKNVKKVNFHETPEDLNDFMYEKYDQMFDAVGVYSGKDKRLVLDGGLEDGSEGPAEVYSHELAHAFDPALQAKSGGVDAHLVGSNSPGWKIAWIKEISASGKKEAPLSNYARTEPSEGWAEYGRLVAESPEKAMKEFPISWQVWREQGLISDKE